eukprot:CAMPEP_0183344718 /NCGR_PEP_ID=MMETSP0164_2-20130417/10322_1 /TAXON_ID=221442 /ORGANISM="Coccolithus pelagicus ssp braarudi, Strain PLY182g" /LENGTH=34 /DNA_ID= /DNA_START= /DNA_END= /DNA_ORIENTATION=
MQFAAGRIRPCPLRQGSPTQAGYNRVPINTMPYA